MLSGKNRMRFEKKLQNVQIYETNFSTPTVEMFGVVLVEIQT